MNTTEIQQKDISAILATGATLRPQLELDASGAWSLALTTDTTRFELVTQKGHARRFRDLATVVNLLRDAGFAGVAEVEL